MESQVRVVFFGQVLEGFHVDDVKRRFGEMFRLDEAKLEQLFSGARTVIKRSLHADDAARYVRTLEKIGVRVKLEPIEAAAPPAAPAALPPLALTPIEAKLKAEAQEREARYEAERHTQHRPLLAQPLVGNDDEEAPGLFGLGFEGRMGRMHYAAAGLLAWSAIIWLVMAAMVWFNALSVLPLIAAFIGLAVWTVRLTVLRLHDLNLSGWWVPVLFVPYVGAVASLVLMFVPGTRGDNNHGGPPRPASALMVVMTLLALGLTVGTLVRLSSVAYKRALQGAQPAAQAPAPAEDVSAYLHSAAAVQAFRDEYLPAAKHKAFAASGSAWGWHAGAATIQDAAAQAIAACDRQRQPYTAKCELVNVNGQWLRD